MKHEHGIPARAMSFMLALVMLIGCISVGFTAFAVEDSYQVLAETMRAEGMRGVIPVYKVSSSPDVKNKLVAEDPRASSAVYVQSTAMWEAMDAFWKVAGALRSKDVGNVTVGENGNVYDGWTGENNTARKLAAAVANKLVAGGYMTADEMRTYDVLDTFNWFIGGYTAEHALLDEPVRGEKPALQPWSNQVFGSTGYFGVTRTRDEALYAGTRNYKQIPATLELNRRWEWVHDARYAKNSAGNVRQYWHVLGAMNTKGNVAGAKGLAFDPAQADTAALKALLTAWDGAFKPAFFARDLSALSAAELEAVKAAVAEKMRTAKSLKVTNSLLYYYGLPTYLDVGAFQREVNRHLELAPYRPFVNFFKNANAKNLKKMNRAALNEEVLAARQGLEILAGVQFGNLSVYKGLVEENGLDMAAAAGYFSDVLYAISDDQYGRDELVDLLISVINGTLTHVNTGDYAPPDDKYVLNSAGLSMNLDQLYARYEMITLINEALTGKVGDTDNFEGFDMATALGAASPGISVPNAVQKALAALRKAIDERDPVNYYNYAGDKPSAFSGFTPTGNYPPAGSEPTPPASFERYPDSFADGAPDDPYFSDDPLTDPGADPTLGTLPNPLDAFATYRADAEYFIANDLADLITAIEAQGILITATEPDDTPYNLTSPVDQALYAAELDDYITEVLSLYDEVKDNYDNWVETKAWIDEYISDWVGAVTPPPPVAVPPTATSLPDRSTYTGPSADADYLADAMTYIGNLTAPQSRYLAGAGAVYPPTPNADEAEMYLMWVGLTGWGANTEFQAVTAGGGKSLMEKRYDYLLDIAVRREAYGEYWDNLADELTIPENAFDYLVTMQGRYDTALSSGIAVDIIVARANYMGAVSNYMSLWAGNGWTSDGTEPLTDSDPTVVANDDRFKFPGLQAAQNEFKTVSDKIVTLNLYGKFFNPYRLSLAEITVAGITTPGMLNTPGTDKYADWNRYSDSDLRAEEAAVKAILEAYRADTTYGLGLAPVPTDWLKYQGRDEADGATATLDHPSVYGAIRDRLDKYLAAAINTTLDMDDYIKAIGADTTGAFGFKDGKPVSIGELSATDPVYTVTTIGLYALISGNDYGKGLNAGKVAYAQRLLAMFRGLIFNYETLHWDLMGTASMSAFPDKTEWVNKLDSEGDPIPIMDGDVQMEDEFGEPMWEMEEVSIPGTGTSWYPVRSVHDTSSIVLVVDQDEFVVRYEHIENFINKLDTLLTSQFVCDLLGPDGFDLSFNQGGGAAVSPAPGEGSAVSRGVADTGLPPGKFHIPELQGDIIMKLGEMRYSSEELVIEDPNTGVKIILPPLDTQLDTSRWVDQEAGVLAQRRWIQAYRGDVLLYLLHYIFEAINTDSDTGAEMLSWLLKTIMGSSSSSVNGQPAEMYSPAMPDGLKVGLGSAVEQAISYALGQVDLTAAVEPFLTGLLGNMVSGMLYGDMLPNTIMGLYKMLCDMIVPLFNTPLDELIQLDPFFSFGIDITLGWLLDELGMGTVNQLFQSQLMKDLLDLGSATSVTNMLELILGAEITPADIVSKCWPSNWPKTQAEADNLSLNPYPAINNKLLAIYEWLSDPTKFGGAANYGKLESWTFVTDQQMKDVLKWGIETMPTDTPAQRAAQRKAMEDVMAFTMSGLAFLLSAVFGNSGLNASFGAINAGVQHDTWYFDIVIPMGWLNDILKGLTFGLWNPNIQDIRISNWFGDNSYDSDSGWPHWKGRYDARAGIYASLTPVNAYGRLFVPLFEMLNIDPILFGSYDGPPALLDQAYFTSLGYTKPIADLKGSYREETFNALLDAYGSNVEKIVRAMNLANDTSTYGGISRPQAKETLKELSRIMVASLLEPLFNWIDPVDDRDLIPYSIGYRPVGKVLDLLPNLAFVVENRIIPKLVNQVIGELKLTVELCLGGFSGKALTDMIANLPLEKVLQDFLKQAIEASVGGTLGKILGLISGGIGWLVGEALKLVIKAAGSITNLFKDQVTGRATLGMFLGFFAGDSAANMLNFAIFKDKYLINPDEDALLNSMMPNGLLGFLEDMIGIDLTGNLNKLVQGMLGLFGIDADAPPTAPPTGMDDYLGLIDKVVQNESHIEGFLIELFNPQTYPCKTFMIYPMVASIPTASGATSAKLNEVNYSDVWTRAKAEFLNDNLMEMLDKWWDFLFAEPFLPWLWGMMNDLLGFDIQNLYTRENLDAILGLLSGLLGGLDISGLFASDMMQSLLPYLNTVQHLVDLDDLLSLIDSLKYIDKKPAEIEAALAGTTTPGYRATVKTKVAALNAQFEDGDRKAFADVIYGLLAPLAPVLKIFLTGGRTADAKGNLIETIWYGELYPNNGARDVGYWGKQTKGLVNGQKVVIPASDNYVWNTKRYLTVTGASDLQEVIGETPEPKLPLYYTDGAVAALTVNDNYTAGTVIPNQWDRARPSEIEGFAYQIPGYEDNEYDPKGSFITIGAEGNNLTLLEDYLGFSGYDGYRQGLIPIYEHLGVPKEDIPTFQQFVLRSTEGGDGYSGDALFFKMLVDPILNLLDRIVDDPINTVIGILPNLLYFLTAEATGADQAYADAKYPPNGYRVLSGTTCINECLNRLLRPIYAILDMLAPLFTVEELLTDLLPMFGAGDLIPADMLTNGGLPLKISLGDGLDLSIDLPIEVSINSLVAGLLKGIDLMGLKIDLTDLTTLVTGELERYKSQNGQDDAVRIKGSGDLPDLLTNLIRKLIALIFTPENKPVVMALVADLGLPDFLQDTINQLLENIYGLMADRTLQGNIGSDLVLSMLFYLLYDANSLADDLLFQRNTYTARIASFFEIIAGSSSPQLRRYAERARRYLNQLYGDVMTPDNGVQKNGFVKFITDFWARIAAFFTGIGDWFMRLIRWIFPFFF